MLRFDEINEEILYTKDLVTKIDRNDIAHLKTRAVANRRKRVRICSHPDVKDTLHEMLIVHCRGNYIPPHRHLGKSESFHIIEGELDVVLFEHDGNIRDIIRMREAGSNDCFYYRLSESLFHTVIPISEIVVFHETTNGPFRPEDLLLPDWAPDDEEEEEIHAYMSVLNKQINAWLAVRGHDHD